MTSDNPYKVLGVDPSASDTRIKAAYRRAVLRWHPDCNLNNQQEATERFRQIIQAVQDISKDRQYEEDDFEKDFDFEKMLAEDKIKRAAQRQREQARPITWNPKLHRGCVATAEAAKQIGIAWITLQRWAGPNSDRLKGIVKMPPLVYKDGKLMRLWSPKQIARIRKSLPKLKHKRHAKLLL